MPSSPKLSPILSCSSSSQILQRLTVVCWAGGTVLQRHRNSFLKTWTLSFQKNLNSSDPKNGTELWKEGNVNRDTPTSIIQGWQWWVVPAGRQPQIVTSQVLMPFAFLLSPAVSLNPALWLSLHNYYFFLKWEHHIFSQFRSSPWFLILHSRYCICTFTEGELHCSHSLLLI